MPIVATNGFIANPTDLPEVEHWFGRHGNTDVNYLRAHHQRFVTTFQFASESLPSGSNILDIGCHWLHQAYFFAREGHRVTCCDAPNTLRQASVIDAAKELNIDLVSYTRIDLAQGIRDLPTDSFDLIIFSEIIEHLAFNPLVMWNELYRVLKPGGRIIITTPNSLYFRYVVDRLNQLIVNGQYGISVSDIFGNGTYGHHWKEFSIHELEKYFASLSSDFSIRKSAIISLRQSELLERAACSALLEEAAAVSSPFNFQNIIEMLEKQGGCPLGDQIFLDVQLKKKEKGIERSPPWLVE